MSVDVSDSPPFHPNNNNTSNSSERLAWVRDYLTQQGIWSGFETSSDWRLSCLFRDTACNQVDSVISSTAVALASKGLSSSVRALCLCLPKKSCYDTIHTVLQSQHFAVFEQVFDLLPPHRHEMCLLFAVTNKADGVLEFLLPRLDSQAFTKDVLEACLRQENHAAGPKVLERLDPLEALREHGKDPKRQALVDQWWSHNLEQGLMPHPAPSRSLNIWLKRLPAVRAFVRAATLDKALGDTQPAAPRRPRM